MIQRRELDSRATASALEAQERKVAAIQQLQKQWRRHRPPAGGGGGRLEAT